MKTHLHTTRIQVQNTQNHDMFFMSTLESQNKKDDTLDRHHGDKSPQTQNTKSPFTLDWVLTINNKLL